MADLNMAVGCLESEGYIVEEAEPPLIMEGRRYLYSS